MLGFRFARTIYRLNRCTMSSVARKKILVTRPDFDGSSLEPLKKCYDVIIWDRALPIPHEELLKEIVGVDAVYCSLVDKINAHAMELAGPQLKCISTISVGYDHIDLAECKRRGIRVGYTPDVLTDATAELAVALLLATCRRLVEANKAVHNGDWKSWAPSWLCGRSLRNGRVGLFGFGRIGQEIAARIIPFKPAVITYTSRSERTEAATKLNVRRVPFEDMLHESDFIIVCCSLTSQTTQVFDNEAFKKMKSTCIIINTARGNVIDQGALYGALKEKRILAAGLDVTTPEPLPLSDPLLALDNVIVLPHIGSADVETRKEMARITTQNILAALNEQKMVAEVSL